MVIVPADNKAYYELGYTEGYAQQLGTMAIQYTYHTHSDSCNGPCEIIIGGLILTSENSKSSGRKYYCVKGSIRHTNKYCSSYSTKSSELHLHDYASSSAAAGALKQKYGITYTSGGGGTTTHTIRSCGKTNSTIESATIIFN